MMKANLKKSVSVVPAGTIVSAGRPLFWPVKRWQSLQRRKFADHLQWAMRSGLNRRLRRIVGAHSAHFSPGNLADLPVTSKTDLVSAQADALAVPGHQIAEWVTTSGTTGQPLRVGLTQADLQRLAENEAVALNIAGLNAGDMLVVALAMDRMFIAGLAYWLGAQKLGATCVRIGSQYFPNIPLLKPLVPPGARAFLITVPSLVAHRPAGRVAGGIKLQAAIGIGEPLLGTDLHPNSLAGCVAKSLNLPAVRVLSTYASTETCTTFAQGPGCGGGHLNPAMGLVEILDQQNQSVPPGTVGQVVITPLGVRGMPLVRFATGDLAALYTDPCPCGRTTPRLGPILGRQAQMLKVRGTTIWFAAIADLLNSAPEIQDYILVVRCRHDLSDDMIIYIQLNVAANAIPETCRRLRHAAAASLKLAPDIKPCSAAQIARLRAGRYSRKPLRFLDLRPVRHVGIQ